MFAGQRHALVTIPQLVELSGFVLAAAGAAVPETGQRRSYLHTLHCHRALDGLAKLDGERQDSYRGRHKGPGTCAGNTPMKLCMIFMP